MSRRVLISIVVLAAVGIIALLSIARLQLLGGRDMVASGLSRMTGREIQVGGPTRLVPGLAPGLRIEGVTVGSAEGSALRSAHIGRLDLVFALWPLVRGDFEVRRLVIDDTQVVLEPSGAGAEGTAREGDGSFGRYSLEQAEVRNLELEIRRGDAAAPATARLERLSLRRRHATAGAELSVVGEVLHVPFELSGRYGPTPPAPDASHPPSIELDGSLGGARVSARGSVDLSSASRSLLLRVRAEATHLQDLSPLAKRDLPPVGPVRASGLVEVRDETFGVSELDLDIGGKDTAWFQLTGYMRDIANQRDFSLKSDFGFDDVRVLAPLVRDPPHIGRVVGQASIHDLAGSTRVQSFTLKGGRPSVFEVDVEGSFEDVKRVHGLDARVDLKARDLTVLGELLHRTLPPIGPVEFSGKVAAQEGTLATRHVELRLHRTHFLGSVDADFQADRRPRITAKLEVPELYLDDLGIEPEGDAGSRATSDTSPGGSDGSRPRLFAETPLDLSWSRVADASLSARADSVSGLGERLMHGLELEGDLKDGSLSLRHVATHVGGGSSRGSLELDSRSAPPTLALTASAKGLDLGRLVEQIDANKAWSGALDAELDLRSRGGSAHALAAGLGGDAVLSCGGGTISTAHVGRFTRDLLRSVGRVVGVRRKSEVLNCLIVDVRFEKGRGTARTLVVDTKDVLIAGKGWVDLGDETLDLRLVPTPRRASPLSTAATVRVEGPLTSPAVKIEHTSLATSTTLAIVDNIKSFTGVRKAWGMLRGGASDQSPCAKLVGGGT